MVLTALWITSRPTCHEAFPQIFLCCNVVSNLIELGLYLQGERAQLTLHVFDIELLLDLLRNPAHKAQQVFEKLVAGNMVTGVQVGTFYPLPLAARPGQPGTPCTPGFSTNKFAFCLQLRPLYISSVCVVPCRLKDLAYLNCLLVFCLFACKW